MKKRCWVLGILLGMAVACQPLPVEKEATSAPTRLPPTPTAGPTPTFPPLETNTPRPTNPIPPTLTPKPTSYAPRPVSSPNGIIEITIPTTWVDTRDRLLDAIKEPDFGRELLFFTDSVNTAEQIISGGNLGTGAYVVGYLPALDPLTSSPAAALAAWVGDAAGTAAVAPVVINGIDAAFIDLAGGPAENAPDLFPTPSEPRQQRVILLARPVSAEPVIIQMGATTAMWPDYEPLFTEMMATIKIQPPGMETVGDREIPTANQGVLTSGRASNGRLTTGMVDIWSFTAPAGQYATISITPRDDTLDLTFFLVSPSGQTLVNVDSGYAGDTETRTDLILEEEGTYLIGIQEFFGTAGPYQISLVLAGEPQFGTGGPITIGQVIMGDLPAGQEQVWTFSGIAGDVVSVILEPEANDFDILLELRDPAGNIMVSLDEGFAGDAEIISGISLPITGEYALHVRGFGGAGGPYSLSLAAGGEETENFYDAGDLTYGADEQEALRSNEAHAWFFNGSTGDEIEIVVTPTDEELDMHIWLLDPDVNRIAEQDAYFAGRAEIIRTILPRDGQYIILIREFTGRAGNYAVRLSLIE
jgi:hypothetical protein